LDRTQDSDKENWEYNYKKYTDKDIFEQFRDKPQLYDQPVKVTPIYNTDPKLFALLTDIWHNQATIIKWLSKIAENTK